MCWGQSVGSWQSGTNKKKQRYCADKEPACPGTFCTASRPEGANRLPVWAEFAQIPRKHIKALGIFGTETLVAYHGDNVPGFSVGRHSQYQSKAF